MTTLQGYAGSNNHHVNTILVVDDVPENLRLLEDLLSGQGYKINATTSGHLAVQSILCNPPDLILLDIIMPEIDGFAVCKKIKGHEKSKDIPIIFISALDQPEDKVKAFNSGGVDYITKPFQAEEVIARVNTHLSIRNCYKKLERQNIELAETARLKEEVDHLMQHDLKNPLTPILSFPKLIRNNRHLTEKQSKYLNQIEQSGYRILDMINRSTDLIKMERGIYQLKPVPVDIMQVQDY